ncbi:MAG: SGNH/GDSL hydrolase family protein [Tatlockia sp.]|nr:SGNH/GDSL hydrolase family protein [Tatlockia sp.]
MTTIKNSSQAIGHNYPTHTGRLKQVGVNSENIYTKVALIGDSTLDNGFWVQTDLPHAKKTHNVTHQTAVSLAEKEIGTYQLANFAVDGATTADLFKYTSLAKVVSDEDHPRRGVNQLNAVKEWQPETVVLSVGGNNYREALALTLSEQLSKKQAFLRFTPDVAKPVIAEIFKEVKQKLLNQYKLLLNQLVQENPKLSRIVLLSQYYPSITELTPYFIYTGFSHVAHAQGKGQTSFEAIEETMNELYREVLSYAVTMNRELVFVDLTSSLNPLGGNHSLQIEPNEKGSQTMGKLIAHAVDYKFEPLDEEMPHTPLMIVRMNEDEASIHTTPLSSADIRSYGVKKLSQFISENRYRHLNLLFSPPTSLITRFESAYYAIGGNQFDAEYNGWFALGLLDLSLITIAASYLWRVAINEELHLALRVIAGTTAAPIILAKLIVSLVLVALFALPICLLHKAIHSLPETNADVEFITEEENPPQLI